MVRVTTMTPQATKPIEEIFFSRTRIRIIKLLTISQMRGRLRLNYAIVASNLAVLEENSIDSCEVADVDTIGLMKDVRKSPH